MTIIPRAGAILAALTLSACATGDPQAGARTVFNNPLAATRIDRTGIGPQCDVDIGRDATCLNAAVIVGRRGRTAILRNGETVRLTRAQARLLRERSERLGAPSNQPPPPPPVLPTADNETP